MTVRWPLLGIVWLASSLAAATLQLDGDPLRLAGDTWQAQLRRADGALLSLSATGAARPLVASAMPLWQLRPAGGGAAIEPGPASIARDGERVRLTWNQPQAQVVATLAPAADHLEISVDVTTRTSTLLTLLVPGRLRFAPADTQRLIMPSNGNDGVGLAFHGSWFALQPQDSPSGFSSEAVGGAGYAATFGGAPEMRPLDDPPVALSVTPAGSALLGPELSRRLAATKVSVFRPSRAAEVDSVLIDSPSGPYFVAKNRGQGRFWRLGGRLTEDVRDPLLAAVSTTIGGLQPAAGRQRVCLLAMRRGPVAGSFTDVTVSDWQAVLARVPAVLAGRLRFEVVETLGQLDALLAAGDVAAVVNPYGEQLPVPADRTMEQQVGRVARFVEAGGNWFEVAGFAFFGALRPQRYLSYGVDYPAGFADFAHLDSAGGSLSVYRVQPRGWEPWAGAKDPRAIFTQGALACGGDADGGWFERNYAIHLTAGQSWSAPPVRLVVGRSAEQSVAAYTQLNGINRGLEQKTKPEVLAKLKQGLLLYLAGNAASKRAALDKLPVPTLVHFADYLKGGFDKQYPDHLPPNPAFGSGADLKALLDEAHARGLLVSPYTNPTWWCVDPVGPTWERDGEVGLLRGLDGRTSYEKYGANAGFTITMWHPAVRRANEVTRRQFTQDYPVDVLFQDQCGARGWLYDTNPASPMPAAYSEGMVSMVDEDSRVVPLGTESGWDRVVNAETQLCGLSWALTTHRNERSYRERFPRETWTIYPLAQRIAHDKCLMLFHDLGQFCDDDASTAWALALGFQLSWHTTGAALDQPNPKAWLAWLDRLQKSLVAPTLGRPLGRFEHTRDGAEDEGLVRASYDNTQYLVNLAAKPRTADGVTLAPYGFRASSPTVRAALLAGQPGYLSSGDAKRAEAWVLARTGETAQVELPAALAAGAKAQIDGQAAEVTLTGNRLSAKLPDFANTATKPTPWPGRAVAVIDLGPGVSLGWATVTPAQYAAALTASKLGAPRMLRTPAEVAQALTEGPSDIWAIINPYGELLPSDPGTVRAQIDRVKSFVNRGGVWWETGGYSFHTGGGQNIGPEGLGTLGIPVGGGEVDAPAEALKVTDTGRAWLGAALADRVSGQMSAVNRGLPRSNADPGHVTLVGAARDGGDDFIGGYRLSGYGWLWRVGGFSPNPTVVTPVVVATLEYLASHPTVERAATGPRRLWHITVAAP